MNFDHPDFAAYKVVGHQKADRIPLNVVRDHDYQVKDIQQSNKNRTPDGFIIPKDIPDYNDNEQLNKQVNRLFEGTSSYERSERFLDDSGDFSTLA